MSIFFPNKGLKNRYHEFKKHNIGRPDKVEATIPLLESSEDEPPPELETSIVENPVEDEALSEGSQTNEESE